MRYSIAPRRPGSGLGIHRGALQVHHAAVGAQRAEQLPVPGVDGVDPPGPGGQQGVGEPAGRRADVERHPAGDRDGEPPQGGGELAGAPRRGGGRRDRDRRAARDAGPGVADDHAVDTDQPVADRPGGVAEMGVELAHALRERDKARLVRHGVPPGGRWR
jgi:hypothetical protein